MVATVVFLNKFVVFVSPLEGSWPTNPSSGPRSIVANKPATPVPPLLNATIEHFYVRTVAARQQGNLLYSLLVKEKLHSAALLSGTEGWMTTEIANFPK